MCCAVAEEATPTGDGSPTELKTCPCRRFVHLPVLVATTTALPTVLIQVNRAHKRGCSSRLAGPSGVQWESSTIVAMPVVRFPFPEPSRVAFAGDWHGNLGCAESVIRSASAAGAEVLVQLGDFGFWPGAKGQAFLDGVSAAATEAGIAVLVVDGNHEDFDQLYEIEIDPTTGLRLVRPGVWHLPRGSRWAWGGVRFGALGGATSLDRPYRAQGRSWWPQEELTRSEVASAVAEGELDVLVCHDCPSGVSIPGIYHRDSSRTKGWPMEELYRAWDHRDLLAEACSALAPTHIWHGHFHVDYLTATGVFGPITRVRGLSEDGDDLARKLEVVELSSLAENVRARRGGDAPQLAALPSQ